MTGSKSPKPIYLIIAVLVVAGALYMNNEPKGVKNNNPLNIRASSDNWVGQVGVDSDGFVIFESVLHGFRAAGRLLRTYAKKHGLTTIAGIVARWAPPVENDTENYINFVSKKTGIDANQALDENSYPSVLAAMVHMENGKQPYAMFDIQRGFEWGFYG